MFGIYHVYQTTCEFGDLVVKKNLVAICADEELANKYAKKHCQVREYDSLYEARCGLLIVENLDGVSVITEETLNNAPDLSVPDSSNPYAWYDYVADRCINADGTRNEEEINKILREAWNLPFEKDVKAALYLLSKD